MSATSVADKLRIRPGGVVWVIPADRQALLGPMPGDVTVTDGPPAPTVAVVFVDDAASVRAIFDARSEALARVPVLWVAYPKGNVSDINRDSLWPILAGHGLRPVGQVAIDGTWSALRFRPLAPGEAPFTGGR